jgi:hypothetical protein
MSDNRYSLQYAVAKRGILRTVYQIGQGGILNAGLNLIEKQA